MHGRQGCLVACVQTEPRVGKGFQTHQRQPDVAHRYRTRRTHRMQSPGQESQDATLLYLMQATFLLIIPIKTSLTSVSDSWVLMPQRRPLYRCLASADPDNLLESESGLVNWLWRNLPSSSGMARGPIKTTVTKVSNFMGFDATGMSFIPLCSWCQAQQPPVIRSRIRLALVEGFAIEFWDHQQPFQHSNFMNNSPLGMNLILVYSWHRAP